MLKNSQLLKKQVEYQKYKGKCQGVSINRDLINFTVLIILEKLLDDLLRQACHAICHSHRFY